MYPPGNLSCDCDRSSPGLKLNQTEWSDFKPYDEGGLKCSNLPHRKTNKRPLSLSFDKNSHHLPPKCIFPGFVVDLEPP